MRRRSPQAAASKRAVPASCLESKSATASTAPASKAFAASPQARIHLPRNASAARSSGIAEQRLVQAAGWWPEERERRPASRLTLRLPQRRRFGGPRPTEPHA